MKHVKHLTYKLLINCAVTEPLGSLKSANKDVWMYSGERLTVAGWQLIDLHFISLLVHGMNSFDTQIWFKA